MDAKFRLVFACPEQTPSAQAYLADEAIVCERLRDAVKLGCETNVIWGVPFIAHRFIVLEPFVIGLLYAELIGEPVTPMSSRPKPDSRD